jgi:hypothetical protein
MRQFLLFIIAFVLCCAVFVVIRAFEFMVNNNWSRNKFSSIQQEADPVHHQTELEFKEEITEVLQSEHSFVRC